MPCFVGGAQRLGDLAGDREGLVERQRPPREQLRQVLTVDQLHHDHRRFGLLEAKHLRDVGMIQCGERLRFLLEPGQALRIGW